ncbi:MAG TPA: 4-(cytidine 5'-diphospho)-2-C-methyl-D-erythritol kinase [Candidatus Limnocylindria bacterium]|nr:4-(cytidine 5'-diphospho)-2-C-methyl-D-erythritol kinase [Candidatus Limnocylindria bacterium]
MSRSVRLQAPAKVNLTLEILGRRPDGDHELRSVFAAIDLRDHVRVASATRLDVQVRPDPGAAPGRELASRAVEALARRVGRPAHAHVRIAKRIPVAAGLGGGSSDAGTTLRALAAIWRADVDLAAVAAELGSDVPFFAQTAPFALVAGRGDQVGALPSPPLGLWIVLVRLRVRVATPDVFAALRPDEWSDGASTERLAAAFRDGTADAAMLRECAWNGLTDAAARVCREIAEVRALAGWKGITLALSGSGPSLFAVADDRADALRVARILHGQGLDARARALGSTAD